MLVVFMFITSEHLAATTTSLALHQDSVMSRANKLSLVLHSTSLLAHQTTTLPSTRESLAVSC
jgi:hypothetical protein